MYVRSLDTAEVKLKHAARNTQPEPSPTSRHLCRAPTDSRHTDKLIIMVQSCRDKAGCALMPECRAQLAAPLVLEKAAYKGQIDSR